MGSNPMRWAVALYWQELEPGFVPDLNAPACFACGYDRLKDWPHVDERRVMRQRWEGAHYLECAHIIAASQGGDLIPSNLLLLCKRCHVDSPMTKRREAMLEWARSRLYILDYWASELAAIVGRPPAAIDCAGIMPLYRHLGGDRHPALPVGTVPSSFAPVLQEYYALHKAGFRYEKPKVKVPRSPAVSVEDTLFLLT